jgi:hypothetical protein
VFCAFTLAIIIIIIIGGGGRNDTNSIIICVLYRSFVMEKVQVQVIISTNKSGGTRVPSPMMLLEFFIGIILPATLWPCGRPSR